LLRRRKLKEPLRKELYLKDYSSAAGIFHQLKDYNHELKMLILQIEVEKERGNFYFALESLNKAKKVMYSYISIIRQKLYSLKKSN
jgi:hypothetical protein